MNELLTAAWSGELTTLTILIWVIIGLPLGFGGGALGGLLVGARDIGSELAAMMGGFYGVVIAMPGILIALILNSLI
ncbi:MAG: hypothetical protein RJS97_08600 [Parvibaculaceae bacterium]